MISLGHFDDEETAARVRDAVARWVEVPDGGRKIRLNFEID